MQDTLGLQHVLFLWNCLSWQNQINVVKKEWSNKESPCCHIAALDKPLSLPPSTTHCFPAEEKEKKTTTLMILWLEWQVGISSLGMHSECHACGEVWEWWKERGGALWERADRVCMAVRSYIEGGVVTRGADGRGASVGPGLSLRT